LSATRLLVLGVVRMYGRAHGYQVRRELLTWSADKWANVQPGSIYHALKKMTTERLLEQVETEPGEAGPERVAYKLTDDGETEFQILLANSLSEPQTPVDISASVTLITTLPRQRAITLLTHQLFKLEADQQSARLLSTEGTDLGKPAHITELYRLWEARSDASIGWLKDLIGKLEAGEYVMADDDQRAFGQPPPDTSQ
jgi:DNA-binding PadR family transcriptional regulator